MSSTASRVSRSTSLMMLSLSDSSTTATDASSADVVAAVVDDDVTIDSEKLSSAIVDKLALLYGRSRRNSVGFTTTDVLLQCK